ncbi:MAG: shikimate dehydrogenase [Sandaracinaceae bacterium]|nr:shikimate dehydrogenase [Sandaracinaceae bacterium]
MTRRFVVIGHPIAHSLSPVMHGAAIAALGLDATYEARDVVPHELPSFVGELRDGALAGANVTIPHKVAIVSLCDRVDADARAVGAVNTLSVEGSRVVGTNTDVVGLFTSLAAHHDALAGRHAVILGAGGAARASVAVCERLGCASITIAARDRDKALPLADGRPSLCAISLLDREPLAEALARAALVIQASSATMGLEADAFVAALPLEALAAHTVVTELVYRPRRTALLAACEARGLITIDGTEMLVQQGAAALARWLGRSLDELPIEAMRVALHHALR